MELLPPDLNGCKSGDLISGSGFEDRPEYQITFTSSSSAVFTGIGQQVEFTVSYQDNHGQEADPSTLERCFEDYSLLRVSTNGTSAMVTSIDFEITSIDLWVRDPVTNAQAQGQIVFAE